MGQTIQISISPTEYIGAYYAQPVNPPKGGIVVIQEIFGVNVHMRRVVDRFAEYGYLAIAPALFDHFEPGVELDYDTAGVDKGRELVAKLGFDQAVLDVASATKALAPMKNIGIVGYCWGGSVAFLCATRLGLPAVSYYGGRTVPFLHERPKAPILFHFGERDSIISPSDIEKHRQALPPSEIYIYPSGHGFNCEMRKDYHEPSSKLALQRTLHFFDQQLKPT